MVTCYIVNSEVWSTVQRVHGNTV